MGRGWRHMDWTMHWMEQDLKFGWAEVTCWLAHALRRAIPWIDRLRELFFFMTLQWPTHGGDRTDMHQASYG
jgi:hypothetical protein